MAGILDTVDQRTQLVGESPENSHVSPGDVEWDFQVANPVRFRLGQMPGSAC